MLCVNSQYFPAFTGKPLLPFIFNIQVMVSGVDQKTSEKPY